jgi:hypothetical protein
MARKVVPGSITQPYKIGKGDFSPNLVGLQFTQGTPLFTLGNFDITTNTSTGISKVYNTGSFSDSYSLETLNLTSQESEILSNESVKTILNLDPTNIERYVYFGSFYEFISEKIKNILLKWKGSLYVNTLQPTDPTQTEKNTILNYSYDSVKDKSYFKIPTSVVINNYALVYDLKYSNNVEFTSTLFNQNENYGEIYNLNFHFGDYQISNTFGDFFVTNFTGSTETDPYIHVEVNKNAWPPLESIGFGSYNYHLRPKEEILNKYFFNLLNEFEKQMLNELTTPRYSFKIQTPKKTDSGTIILAEKTLTWPTSDGYNLDSGGGNFQIYVSSWLNEANSFDELKTDLISRRFVTGSIIDFDTDGGGNEVYGRKVNKLLRIYGREFDEIKKYIDGISFARVVTYNKKDNTPDHLVKILASELGLDVLLSFFENNLFKNDLPNDTTQEGYGNLLNIPFSGYSRNLSPKEMDIELWRRLVINAWWLFKSKGHRKVLEFFLNLFKIQQCVISLDEYIYIAKNAPLDVNKTFDLIAKYLGVEPLGSGVEVTDGEPVTNVYGAELDVDDYPIDVYGFPKLANNSPEYYYQLNGFWYNGGNLSEAGNNPHIGPYDYGKAYLSSLECFIDSFEGVTTGTTTFNTLDNLFIDYENGTVENGLNNFGEDYAEIMNTTNRGLNNVNIVSAGADNQISFGESQQSFRIIFNLNCVIPCPTEFINYGNGVIFIGFDDTTSPLFSDVEPKLSQFPQLYLSKPQVLIQSLEITEICCKEIGGYYLPNLDNDINIAEDIFTIEELFEQNSTTKPLPEPKTLCYWCPPTQILCDEDYYGAILAKQNSNNEPTNKQRVQTQGQDDDVKDVIGCTDSTAKNYNAFATKTCEGYTGTYLKSNCNSGAPPNAICSGCCYKIIPINTESGDPIKGDGTTENTFIGEELISEVFINNNPCGGLITQENQSPNQFLINGKTVKDIGCCTELLMGAPVEFTSFDSNGDGKLDSSGCVPKVSSIDCSQKEIYINGGVVFGIKDSRCCTEDFVGQPVVWDGIQCKVKEDSLCVILTNDNQNITNAECCKLKMGYLSKDYYGNTVCIKESVDGGGSGTGGNGGISFTRCSRAELASFTSISVLDNDGNYELLQTQDGKAVSKLCCVAYDNLNNNETWTFNSNLGCTRNIESQNMEYQTGRYQLVESFLGRFIAGINNTNQTGQFVEEGIFSLETFFGSPTLENAGDIRVLLKIRKLTINGVEYIQGNPPSAVIGQQLASPDIKNSVLFLQQVFNQYGLTDYKAQLPGTPKNISGNSPSNTGGVDNKYGFYIISPKEDNYYIEYYFHYLTLPESKGAFTFEIRKPSVVTNLNVNPEGPPISNINFFFDSVANNSFVPNPTFGYVANKITSVTNETCFTINQTIPTYGVEPEQCYPYTLGQITYD